MNHPPADAPIFFERNRVFRVYRGGKLFHDFFGDEPIDGNSPEEWIASSVRALNKESKGPTEGLSVVEGTQTTLASLLADFPQAMTGGRRFDVLVKLLDSAVRLPAQTHPDKEYSRRHFQSEYGKTEMWLILATRPGANLYFGFKDGVTRADLENAVERSEQKGDAFSALLQEVPARPGDVWLIPARVAHAIGAGCLILEVQEPTDFTIQPERWCDDYRLSDREMYLGLPRATALDCFDLARTGEQVIAQGRRRPIPSQVGPAHLVETLIRYEDTPCFAVNRHTIRAGEGILGGPAVYVVTEGAASLRNTTGSRTVRKGDYFFLPHAAGQVAVAAEDRVQLVECLPPEREEPF